MREGPFYEATQKAAAVGFLAGVAVTLLRRRQLSKSIGDASGATTVVSSAVKISVAAVALSAATGLIMLRSQSVMGRLFIWRICLGMIWKKPFGYGVRCKAMCLSRKKSCDILYAFENFNDFRCALLFTVTKENAEEDLADIAEYLASQAENKRKKMQWGRSIIVNGKPIRHGRVEHDDNWDRNIRLQMNML